MRVNKVGALLFRSLELEPDKAKAAKMRTVIKNLLDKGKVLSLSLIDEAVAKGVEVLEKDHKAVKSSPKYE